MPDFTKCPHCGESLGQAVDKWTTLRVSEESAEMLRRSMHYPDRNIEDVLRRLLQGEGEVFFRVLMVDGEGAETSRSTVEFQLGDEPPRYYRFEAGKTRRIPAPTRLVVAKER